MVISLLHTIFYNLLRKIGYCDYFQKKEKLYKVTIKRIIMLMKDLFHTVN